MKALYLCPYKLCKHKDCTPKGLLPPICQATRGGAKKRTHLFMPSSLTFLKILLRGLLTAELGAELALQPGEGRVDCST